MAVGIDDVIDEIEEALYAANRLREREIERDDSKQIVIDAINQIRRGDYVDAITTLEREFLPKWQSTEGCLAAYAKATGADPVAREVGREVERALA